jgi:hypothetical protein
MFRREARRCRTRPSPDFRLSLGSGGSAKGSIGIVAVVHRLSRTYGLGLQTGPRSLARQDGHFLRSQQFPFGCSQRLALDETEPFWFRTVGGETEQVVSTRAAAPAAWTVLYP